MGIWKKRSIEDRRLEVGDLAQFRGKIQKYYRQVYQGELPGEPLPEKEEKYLFVFFLNQAIIIVTLQPSEAPHGLLVERGLLGSLAPGNTLENSKSISYLFHQVLFAALEAAAFII